ncbi:MAG: copper amine oxidase N-terminal domain-containing protein [Lawsonella sp.]
MFQSKVRLVLVGAVIGFMLAAVLAVSAAAPIKLIIDDQEIACDVPPQIIGGRTMVPARFVAEPLGATVEWDQVANAVVITSISYSDEEIKQNLEGWIPLRDIALDQGWIVRGDGFVYQDEKKLFNWQEIGKIIDAKVYVPTDLLSQLGLL